MSVNRNLFKKKKKRISSKQLEKGKYPLSATCVNPLGCPVQSKGSEESSPTCHLTAIAREAPGKTSPAEMSHSTELEDIMINYFKVLNLWLFGKQQ